MKGPHDPALYLAAWAEQSRSAFALLSLDLRLMWANAAAAGLFSEGRHFTVREGGLVAVDHGQAAAMRAFFQRVAEDPVSWVCTAADEFPMIMCAHRLQPASGASAFAVSLYATDPAQRYVWTEFGEAFHLTRAEVAVVKRILDGANAEEVAEDQGVSV